MLKRDEQDYNFSGFRIQGLGIPWEMDLSKVLLGSGNMFVVTKIGIFQWKMVGKLQKILQLFVQRWYLVISRCVDRQILRIGWRGVKC